ncbi:MAG: hypothetical protein ACAI44_01155 [Candidatus Sericytochromatia bacterium]
MKDLDTFMPVLQLLPIDGGDDLKVYALNGQAGQLMPPCRCNQDAYVVINQGVVRIDLEGLVRMMQPRENEFLPANTLFHLEVLNDCRAQLVIPSHAQLEFI